MALGWDLRICIASKFPGGANVVSQEHTFLGKLDPQWERGLFSHTVGLKQNKTQAPGLWLLPPAESPAEGLGVRDRERFAE